MLRLSAYDVLEALSLPSKAPQPPSSKSASLRENPFGARP
jgi:hypothetical protein